MTKEKSLQESIDSLEKEVKLLEKRVAKQNSFKRRFLMSVMGGFAGALGATVVFAVILAGVVQLARSIDYVPILNNVLSSKELEDIINKFTLMQ